MNCSETLAWTRPDMRPITYYGVRRVFFFCCPMICDQSIRTIVPLTYLFKENGNHIFFDVVVFGACACTAGLLLVFDQLVFGVKIHGCCFSFV